VAWDKEKYDRSINHLIKTDNLYTIGMGDYIDNVMAWANGGADKRWNPETIERDKLTTEEQIEYFTKSWAKVAHKSFGLLSGNHEWKTINQKRFIRDFCTPVDPDNPTRTLYIQKYLGRLALIGLTFTFKGREVRHYEILAFHGGYSGNRDGGIENRMEDIAAGFEGLDLIMMGHTHSTKTATKVMIGRDRKTNRPYERKQIIANTGTFLKSYSHGVDSYVEINPKRAKRVGTVTITFNPYTGNIYGHD
jgi:hypothetical protein